MMTKDLDQVTVRCQRLLMRLMRFNPIVRHVPGKELVIADALSRSPSSSCTTCDIVLADEIEEQIEFVQASWPVSSHRLHYIQTETAADPVMQTVMYYVMHQWPQSDSQVVPEVKPYIQAKGQLSVVDGVLTYADRIVIPPNMRCEILGKLHESHQGVSKCRENANSAVWWPGMGTDIKQLVDNCSVCQENRPKQHSEPLLPTNLPGRPWDKIAADLFEIKRKHFIVVIDYYSRWIEIKALPSTSSNAVIGRMKDIFAQHGIPDELVSDNGPQFVAEEFRAFARRYEFQHKTSSPHFPQANGEAEAAVKIAKKIICQEDADIALLNYRNTPHSATQISPAEALLGRKLKTRVPVLAKNLVPKTHDLTNSTTFAFMFMF